MLFISCNVYSRHFAYSSASLKASCCSTEHCRPRAARPCECNRFRGTSFSAKPTGESLLFIINGEGAEYVEGREHPIKAGDVIFMPPGAKHTIVNKTDTELRFLEFFTHPPVGADKIDLE